MKNVTYRVPDDFQQRLKVYAVRRSLSLNKAINDALDEALEATDINNHLGHHGPKARDK